MFRVDAALSTLSAQVCVHGPVPRALVYGSLQAAAFVHGALPVVDGRMYLRGVRSEDCIEYTVDLAAAVERDLLLLAYPGEHALVVSTDLFLWRAEQPEPRVARARFELPPGVEVSVPWSRDGAGGYRLDERAFAFVAHAAFGRFERERIPAPGGEVEVVILPGFPEATHAQLLPWLQRAVRSISDYAGTLPAPFVQVIVAPTAASPRPIQFGHTGRGGAPSILLFTPTDSGEAVLRSDWIAVHELAHLLHPLVARDDAWLSEGLATYVQELLRVRSGSLDAREAWRRIYEGARLGREATGTLEDETRRMHHENNYARVYWAGAAIALMADVALRERSGGKLSLERVLAAGLGSCRNEADHAWSAREVIAELDAAAGTPVFAELTAQYLRAP
ncbi:MAG TPA: hypothetical protein VHM19_14190, partial [Polyangiales bacterium]|nr:hypothetical protein [Polyangiales bacterium]